MARRIETPLGTLLGLVDRAARRVVWSLECPECGRPIQLSKEQFHGEAATTCEGCGWKTPRESSDPPRWYDFTVAFNTVPPREQREAVR